MRKGVGQVWFSSGRDGTEEKPRLVAQDCRPTTMNAGIEDEQKRSRQ